MINELIDLTEHRDFGDRLFRGSLRIESRDFWESVNRRLYQERYGKLIWKVDTDDFRTDSFDGIFPLGNKQQRQTTLEMYYWGSRDATHCDCCGIKIRKIPWKFDSGLCKKCAGDKMGDPKFPWL